MQLDVDMLVLAKFACMCVVMYIVVFHYINNASVILHD